eukprot:TRINITY_DN114371_c0_g1_i1.p1 TRINITY_DN114371_c0_g1~~TRINITY_DN114371_c0_g1_i1.p1  ORF type:complete len:616 (+),score=90.19 TRINITY_DN114371_c0_g1_i1:44-1849(+)
MADVLDSLSLEDNLLISCNCPPPHVEQLLECCGRRSSLLCHLAVERFLRCVQTCTEAVFDLVYHRTQSSSLESIMQVGFVAPDGRNVNVAHGNRYGPGIYTSWEDPSSKYGANLVLCLAVRGDACDRNLQVEDGLCSRVVEGRRLTVYRHGCQVLPVALLSEEVGTEELYSRGSLYHSSLPPRVSLHEEVTQEAFQLAERISARVFAMKPSAVRGKWVTEANLFPSRQAALSSVHALKHDHRWSILQWTRAEKFLSTDRRLRVEMSAVKGLFGEDCICKVSGHTFENSLDEWQVEIRTGERTVSVRVAFPMCYPRWPPHLFLMGLRSNGSHDIVSEQGGINTLKLMGLTSWEPAVQVHDLLDALRPMIVENRLALSEASTEPRLSIASFCGDGRNFLAGFSGCSVGPSSESQSSPETSCQDQRRGTFKRRRTQEITSRATALREDFKAMLDASAAFAAELGSAPNFSDGKVGLVGKVTRREFKCYTAFEHVQLTILGFAQLSEISAQVLGLNNGATFFKNPGTMLLEKECGMTMHADRPGAIEAVKNGPDIMLNVFAASQAAGKAKSFFQKAFDRHHDPCLEGRVALLQEFWQDLLLAEHS